MPNGARPRTPHSHKYSEMSILVTPDLSGIACVLSWRVSRRIRNPGFPLDHEVIQNWSSQSHGSSGACYSIPSAFVCKDGRLRLCMLQIQRLW